MKNARYILTKMRVNFHNPLCIYDNPAAFPPFSSEKAARMRLGASEYAVYAYL